MAHNSTSRRRIGAALGALGVSVFAAAALVGMAGTASAHTPRLEADCSDGVSWLKVELTQYNDRQANTVTVTVDGEVVVDEEFGREFTQEWTDLDPTLGHEVNVAVQAWDDPNSTEGFSFSEDLTIEACVQPTSPPSSETSVPEEPTSSVPAPPSSSTPVETTTTTAAPTTSIEVEEAGLADTGASIAIPLGIGALLLAGGVVLMVVVRRRGRA